MEIGMKVVALALVAAATIMGCQRCGSAPAVSDAGDAMAANPEPTAAPADAPDAATADLPEVRDTGRGRATAALRAIFASYGIEVDAAAIERECKVDDDGASIDDLEDVAEKHGLDAAQVVVPPEHVFLPEAKLLPAIVVVEGPDETVDFAVVWRVEGDRVRVMDPSEGNRLVDRAELAKSLHQHEMSIAADELAGVMASQPFRDALRARVEALGVARAQADALLAQAAAAPGWRGVAALDAAVRQLAADPSKAVGDARARLAASLDCALSKRCDGVDPIPPAMWMARAGSNDEPRVHGVLMLTIAGRHAP